MSDRPAGIQSLFGDAVRETGDLARKELALFRAELSQNIQGFFLGFVLIIVAAVFAVASLIWLTQALAAWLATVLDSEALAALVVGGGLFVFAAAFAFYGMRKISVASLVPTRTIESVGRDIEIVSEKVSA